MSCAQVRELLELSFGAATLPPEVEQHLAECPECRSFHDELAALADEFGSAGRIEFSEYEVGRAVALVDQAIAGSAHSVVISVSWLRRLTRVAAAVLIVAASWATYQFGRHEGTQIARTSSPADATYVTASAAGYADESAYINDDMINALIEDYGPGGLVGNDQNLIDDISDEEMQYLMQHFDVGELL